MRTLHTGGMIYISSQDDHNVLSRKGDNLRRRSWSPGYYSVYVPLLTRTSEPFRVSREETPETDEMLASRAADRLDDDGAPMVHEDKGHIVLSTCLFNREDPLPVSPLLTVLLPIASVVEPTALAPRKLSPPQC